MNLCDTSVDEREIALMVAPSISRSSSVVIGGSRPGSAIAGCSSAVAGGSSVAGSGTEGNSAAGSPAPSVASDRGRRKKNALSLVSRT